FFDLFEQLDHLVQKTEDNIPNAPVRQRRTRNDLPAQSATRGPLQQTRNSAGAMIAGMTANGAAVVPNNNNNNNNNSNNNNNNNSPPLRVESDELPLNFFATLMHMTSQSIAPSANPQSIAGDLTERSGRQVAQSPNQDSFPLEVHPDLLNEAWNNFERSNHNTRQSNGHFEYSFPTSVSPRVDDDEAGLSTHHTRFVRRNNAGGDNFDDPLQSWSQRIDLSGNGE
ncbi:hypothetical protein RFI_23749, partial [Reticulomyxa filosa]